MTISMDKQYTSDGDIGDILRLDGPGPFPVVWQGRATARLARFTLDGAHEFHRHLDLIEANMAVASAVSQQLGAGSNCAQTDPNDFAVSRNKDYGTPIDVDEGHGLEGGE